MKNRRTIALFLTLSVLLGAGAWRWAHPRSADPVYQGTPLSEWFARLVNHGGGGMASNDPAVVAILAMGPDAVPFLMRQLWLTSSPVHNRAVDLLNQFAKSKTLPDRDRQGQAFLLLAEMGPRAEAAVPDLIDLAARREAMSRSFAVHLLGTIHRRPELCIPVLEEYVRDRDSKVSRRAIVALGQFGPEAKRSLPVLIPHLGSTGRDGLEAAIAVARIDARNPDLGLPMLITNWTTNQDAYARSHIAQAIKGIDPEAAAKAGVN